MSGFRVFNKRTDQHTFREGAATATIFTIWRLDNEPEQANFNYEKTDARFTNKCPYSKYPDAIWPQPFLTYDESGMSMATN